jgi:hypothetical protein
MSDLVRQFFKEVDAEVFKTYSANHKVGVLCDDFHYDAGINEYVLKVNLWRKGCDSVLYVLMGRIVGDSMSLSVGDVLGEVKRSVDDFLLGAGVKV